MEDNEQLLFREFFRQVRRYQRAHQRFLNGSPSTLVAKEIYEREFESLKSLILRPEFQSVLDKHFASFDQSTGSGHTTSFDPDKLPAALVARELSLVSVAGYSKTESRHILQNLSLRRKDDQARVPSDSKELLVQLTEIHKSTIVRIQELRELPLEESAGKEKRKRKREIRRAVLSGTWGTAMIVSNIAFAAATSLITISLALGGTAIHQALRDAIGD